ncbi:MAG: IS30 family transposase [Chitinophagaceae bacterium]|nr:IS30 family transposase [Chitinophagaceae bacterium]
MLQAELSRKKICEVIGKDKSVLSREIARNADKRSGKYDAGLAQRKSDDRHISKSKRQTFTSIIKLYVDDQLTKKYSPEQIVGLAKKEGVDCVSHERIYQYLWTDKRKKGRLFEHLRTQDKRYRKRGSAKDRRGIIKDRVDISQRPPAVEKRERIGDLEIDTIIGKNHQGAIVTINDRVTGMVKMEKLESKDADELAKATIALLQDWKPFIHTITSDNGKEFAAHKMISESLDIDFFFARPYHSWERGSNENLNGLIRQYIPKKTDFNTITDEYVKHVESELNNRPRKRFNFETPNDIYKKKIVAFIT